MTFHLIPKYADFKDLNPNNSDYRNAANGIYNEMMLRQTEQNVDILKIARGGKKWDHKPVLKKHLSPFFHKTLRNKNDRPATVYGTMISGDMLL